jgi:hypothetical protein
MLDLKDTAIWICERWLWQTLPRDPTRCRAIELARKMARAEITARADSLGNDICKHFESMIWACEEERGDHAACIGRAGIPKRSYYGQITDAVMDGDTGVLGNILEVMMDQML